MTPESVVVQGLHAVSAGLSSRDTDALLAVFAPDAVLIGSGADETCFGADQLRAHFDAIWARGYELTFHWGTPEARREGHLVWFFLAGEVEYGDETGSYRLTGVLREVEPGAWCWQLWHGSQPTG